MLNSCSLRLISLKRVSFRAEFSYKACVAANPEVVSSDAGISMHPVRFLKVPSSSLCFILILLVAEKERADWLAGVDFTGLVVD